MGVGRSANVRVGRVGGGVRGAVGGDGVTVDGGSSGGRVVEDVSVGMGGPPGGGYWRGRRGRTVREAAPPLPSPQTGLSQPGGGGCRSGDPSSSLARPSAPSCLSSLPSASVGELIREHHTPPVSLPFYPLSGYSSEDITLRPSPSPSIATTWHTTRGGGTTSSAYPNPHLADALTNTGVPSPSSDLHLPQSSSIASL